MMYTAGNENIPETAKRTISIQRSRSENSEVDLLANPVFENTHSFLDVRAES